VGFIAYVIRIPIIISKIPVLCPKWHIVFHVLLVMVSRGFFVFNEFPAYIICSVYKMAYSFSCLICHGFPWILCFQ
jgi:hypothetical protein